MIIPLQVESDPIIVPVTEAGSTPFNMFGDIFLSRQDQIAQECHCCCQGMITVLQEQQYLHRSGWLGRAGFCQGYRD